MAATTNNIGKSHYTGNKNGELTPFPSKNAWKDEDHVEMVKKACPYGKHQRDIDRYERSKKPKTGAVRRLREKAHRNAKHSKEFDSTLGYPGEGPLDNSIIKECTLGCKCMIAGHYHQKKSPKKGAAKRLRDKKGKKDPRSDPVYEKCESIANIQCGSSCHAHDSTQCLQCAATLGFIARYQESNPEEIMEEWNNQDNIHDENSDLDSGMSDIDDLFVDGDLLNRGIQALREKCNQMCDDYKRQEDKKDEVVGETSIPVVEETTDVTSTCINTSVHPVKGEEAKTSIVASKSNKSSGEKEEVAIINTQVYPIKGEEALASVATIQIQTQVPNNSDVLYIPKILKNVIIFTTAHDRKEEGWIDSIKNEFYNLFFTKVETTINNVTTINQIPSNITMHSTHESAFKNDFLKKKLYGLSQNSTDIEYFTNIYPTYYRADVYQDCVDIVLMDCTLAKRRAVDPDGKISDIMTAVKSIVMSHARARTWLSDQKMYVNTMMYITNCVLLRGMYEASANPKTIDPVFRSADLTAMSRCLDPRFV